MIVPTTEADPNPRSEQDPEALGGRVEIDATAPLHVQATLAIRALAAANDPEDPRVFVRGRDLVRVTEFRTLEPFTPDSLRDRLSQVAVWTGESGGHRTKPPVDVTRTVLARDSAEYPDIPRVDRVVSIPTLGSSGAVLDRPGYHAAERVLYSPDPALGAVDVPERVTPGDADDARALLFGELLGDFGFADEASRANALALLLTPFVRDFIDGPTPLFVIRAHDPGWGKGLLTDVCLMPSCGSVEKTPGAESDDEWRKRITAALRGAPPVVAFDNLEGSLTAPTLAQALTEEIWSDRLLGESKTMQAPIRNVWVATGNNLEVSRDLADRSVPILLGPPPNARHEVETPRHRDPNAWTHARLREWTRDNRARLVEAALTLVRHWLDGRVLYELGESHMREPDEREFPDATMGSFDGWTEGVGGIVKAAGVERFLENRAALASEIVEAAEDGTAEFLRAWHALGAEPMPLGEVVTECTMGRLRGQLPDGLEGLREERLRTKLSAWIRTNHGRWIDGHRLVHRKGRSGGAGNRKHWYVVRATG